ncbi:MAG: YSC84-related protein [Sphingomonadales bacterium]
MQMLSNLKAAALVLVIAAFAAAPAAAEDNTAELEAKSDTALSQLYEKSADATELAKTAKGILVFPSITKGGFIVGGQYGKGVLRQDGKSTGYFSSASGSIGLQAGIESFGYVLMLMSDKAIAQLDAADGWEVGTGPSIVIIDEGAGTSITSRTTKADVYAFVFSQKGLMGGIALQGTKISRLKRP